jgi:sialate O-acetylesterase
MQQGVQFPIQGQSAAGASLSVSFLGAVYHVKADVNGTWQALLAPAEAGGPYTLSISEEGAAEPLLLSDIYCGDLWLCSGQSNMELPMSRIRDDFADEWDNPNPLIRQFTVPLTWDFSGPRQTLEGGAWLTASAQTLDQFSGTAWFFAQQYYKKHAVPVGIVLAAVGGAPIEALMSKESLAPFPQKIAACEQYADTVFAENVITESAARDALWYSELERHDEGLSGAWFKPETDDSAWRTVSVPAIFDSEELCGFHGALWLRRSFNAPASCVGVPLKAWLGTMVDADTVYLNGQEIGSTTYRYPPRKYSVPAGLVHEGENSITIRLVCAYGPAGITPDKPFCIFSETGRIALQGQWRYRTTAALPRKPESFFIQWQPCGLFNAMIAPLLRSYPLRGVLWYQGESNDANPDDYAALFTALIRDWRASLSCAQLPFCFVQLPLYGEPEQNTEKSRWAVLREAQSRALALPATGMASALDLGEWNDLHPLNKKGVGMRLALAVEKVVYHERNSSPGPLLEHVVHEGETLILHFKHCAAGLVAAQEPVVLTLIGEDARAVQVQARISGVSELRVDTAAVKNPHKILYAWADNPQDRQLYNSEGLPALPFRHVW